MADPSLVGQPWPDVLATSQTATIIYLLALSIAFVYLRHTAKLASGRNSVVSLLEQSHAAAASQLISYKGRTGKSSTSMLIEASDGCSIYIYHERCFSILHGAVLPDNSRERRDKFNVSYCIFYLLSCHRIINQGGKTFQESRLFEV
jgi:hypothetical protein